jgi:NAD(P)H-dependent FMN reductase
MGKVIAIVGSYRKGGITDQAVDAVLEGARVAGAQTAKIYLIDQNIQFCRNCRACAAQNGLTPGRCVQQDDLDSVLRAVDDANAIVLGSPVNYYNVTAVFRKFMERLLGFAAYWPWGKNLGPKLRSRILHKKAVLVCSAGMPAAMIPFASGATSSLKLTARLLGAAPSARLWIGHAAVSQDQQLDTRTRDKAVSLGRSLV